MAKHTKQVIISYDSDEAGQAATRKAVRMLSDVGLDVRILRMEGAKDPDEYIKKYGADSFRRLLDSSRTGFEFKMETTLGRFNLDIPSDKIKASAELCEYISEVWSEVERDVYISATARRLSLPAEGLKNDVERIRRKKIKTYNEKTVKEARLGAMGVGDKINVDAIKNVKAKSAEEAIIGLLLIYDEYRDGVACGKIALTSEDFFSDFHRRVFEKVIEMQKSDRYDFSLLGEFFSPDEIGRLQGLMQKRRALTENGKAVFIGCVDTLKKEKGLAVSPETDSIDAIRRLLESKRGANKQ